VRTADTAQLTPAVTRSLTPFYSRSILKTLGFFLKVLLKKSDFDVYKERSLECLVDLAESKGNHE
jgi:hypothetical protein